MTTPSLQEIADRLRLVEEQNSKLLANDSAQRLQIAKLQQRHADLRSAFRQHADAGKAGDRAFIERLQRLEDNRRSHESAAMRLKHLESAVQRLANGLRGHDVFI